MKKQSLSYYSAIYECTYQDQIIFLSVCRLCYSLSLPLCRSAISRFYSCRTQSPCSSDTPYTPPTPHWLSVMLSLPRLALQWAAYALDGEARPLPAYLYWVVSFLFTCTLYEVAIGPALNQLFRAESGCIRHGVPISLWELIWGG